MCRAVKKGTSMVHKLGIVVPYRDRQEHLADFLPHMMNFFCTDSKNKDIPCRIIIIEQTDGLPFNRGTICNIGYKLLRDEIDYVCFHDVDFLPINADYRRADQPTMVIHHGFEFQPFDHKDLSRGHHKLPVKELFSAVVLLANQHFEQANGFSNSYWGWG